MNRQPIITEWIESTEAAIEALRDWQRDLQDWRRQLEAGETVEYQGELLPAFRQVCEAGLEGWIDHNPAGGGIDTLAAVVRGDNLPEPKPAWMDETAIIEAVFG